MTAEEYKNKKIEIYNRLAESEEYNERNLTNGELCHKCGGKCCRNYPCVFSPEDFIDIYDLDYMKSILDTGYFVIDTFFRYQGEDIIYYVRPRGVDDDNVVTDPDKRGRRCILHTDNGCMLDFYTRPSGGALLIPNPNRIICEYSRCDAKYSSTDQYEEWCDYQDVMLELLDYYSDKKIAPNASKINKLSKIIRQDDI